MKWMKNLWEKGKTMIQLVFWFGHILVCLIPTLLFGCPAGVVGGLYIELAQLDVALGDRYGYNWGGFKKLMGRWNWLDTIIDLGCDGVGVYLGWWIRELL